MPSKSRTQHSSRSKKISVAVVIPSYNESSVLKQVVSAVKKFASLVVVVDDGSNLPIQVSKLGIKTVVLRHPINLGQGAALQTGFNYVLEKTSATHIVTFDADGQFDPNEINRLIKLQIKTKVDILLGSRFLGATKYLSWPRKMLLKLGILFTWIFSGILLTDTHNGFRVITRAALKKIELVQNRMAHASEIIDLIRRYKLSYQEAPVTVTYTDYSKNKGQSNLNSLNIIRDLFIWRFFE